MGNPMKRFLSILVPVILFGCTAGASMEFTAPVKGASPPQIRRSNCQCGTRRWKCSLLPRRKNPWKGGIQAFYLLQKGELRKLWSLFDENLQSQVPYSKFEQEMKAFSDQHPIRDMTASRFFPIGRSSYAVIVHEWGEKGLAVYIGSDGLGAIHDFSTTPLELNALNPEVDPASQTEIRLPFEGL